MSGNLILTGFMGTGKSTVGRRLAELLELTFVDTDSEIERRHGSIPDIFDQEGEAGFRRYEAAVAAELAQMDDLVIATGGRLMLDEDNAAALSASGEVFCLTAESDEIIRRVLGDGVETRPLLADPDPAGRVRSLLEERAQGYGRFTQISTDGRSVEDIVLDIVNR